MTLLSVERVGQVLRLRRWLLVFVSLLFAIYAAVGFLLVPYVARSAIEKYVVQDLGRRVVIGKITFNPFTFTAEVAGFALTEANGTSIASFDLFRINAQISSIVNRAWTFAEVRLEHPNLNVLIDSDGSLNLAKLHPATVGPSSPVQSVHVPALRIATLAVRDGHIGFEDHNRLRATPFSTTLAPIEFTLTDFRTTPDFQNAYNFEGSTAAGERLAWSGQFSIQPLGSTGRFTIASLKATTIAAYLGDALAFNLYSGSIDLQGEYRVAFDDKLRLNIDLPQSKLHDLAIGPKGTAASSSWITLPAADLSGTSLSLQDRTVRVERIQIDNAKVTAWRGSDGQINLQRLFSEPPAGNSLQTTQPNTTPVADASWAIGVNTLYIRAASIDAEDRMVDPTVKLNMTPVTINISNYSTKRGNVTKTDVSIGVGASGRITARGDLSLVPFASNLALDVADIDLAPLQPYLARSTALQPTTGKISLKGTLSMTEASQGTEPQLKIAGDLAIANVAARDKASRQSILSWESLRLAGVAYSQNPDRLDIERIEAHRPYARVIISEQRTLNIMTALDPSGVAQPGSAGTAATPRAAAQPMPVRIRSVVIQDGSADFSDLSVEPNFSATLLGLNGGASGLSSDPTSRAEVKISGNVDRYAPVAITGRVNLLSAALFTDITANFHNMELTTFNPYSGKYAGYSISKGKLTTELHYKVENRKLDAQHHIVLDQIEFGAATESKDKVSLPVRLAAALLKDRHGVIDINLPVSGSLDDPEFRVGPLVWKAFLGLITKSATAPFRLLGSLFGRGEEVAFIDFIPGSATLSPDQVEKITVLAKALVERPQLRLDVPLQTLAAADDEALERAQLDAALAPLLPASDASTVVTQEQRLAALAQLYQQQLGATPVYPPESSPSADPVNTNIAFLERSLRPRFAPTADRRGQLAHTRADVVQAAVLANTEIAPERVFLTERESGKTTVPGAVRMEFRLE